MTIKATIKALATIMLVNVFKSDVFMQGIFIQDINYNC